MEVGCSIECTADGCTYSDAHIYSLGQRAIPLYANSVAIWHAHPVNDSSEMMAGHDDDMRSYIKDGIKVPFTIFTSNSSTTSHTTTMSAQLYPYDLVRDGEVVSVPVPNSTIPYPQIP